MALREMALVLAAGGLLEGVPPLIAKALCHALAVRSAEAGNSAADPTLADHNEVLSLAGTMGIPSEAERVLSALRPGAGVFQAGMVAELTRSANRLIQALHAG
jgi:hypothetical protein